VLWVPTGGTFASEPGDDGYGNRKPTRNALDLVYREVPDAIQYADLTVSELDSQPIDSTEADVEHFIKCAWLHFNKFRERFVGHVHTTGTDTLAEKAAALALSLRKPPVPIILTGAQRGFDARHSDAATNFRDALFAAAHPDMPPGVHVVFHHRIIDATVVEKRSTASVDAFGSHNDGDIGCVIAPGHLEIFRPVHHAWIAGKPELVAKFDPCVKVEYLTATYTAAWLDGVLSRDDVHGLILCAFGLGGVPSRLLPVLKRHAPVKPIIITTQCPDGPTNLDEYAVGVLAAETGALSAGTLSLAYANVLLQHLLAVTCGLEDLRKTWAEAVHYRLGAAVPRLGTPSLYQCSDNLQGNGHGPLLPAS
jgi:L-asparaginase/Glu-tRNA(Gln) amidotransferase subunit D